MRAPGNHRNRTRSITRYGAALSVAATALAVVAVAPADAAVRRPGRPDPARTLEQTVGSAIAATASFPAIIGRVTAQAPIHPRPRPTVVVRYSFEPRTGGIVDESGRGHILRWASTSGGAARIVAHAKAEVRRTAA